MPVRTKKMKTKPTFTLIAGINGAGKSTAYTHMKAYEKALLGMRINPDEFARRFGGVIIGGKEAVKVRNQYLSERITFHQETTFTGKSILKMIDTAKDKGYYLNLIFVSVDSTETSVTRVADRVSKGGHDIPIEIIRKRYPESLENLTNQICKFDKIRLVDNTKIFDDVFRAKDGKILFIGDSLPQWAVSGIRAYKDYVKSKIN